MTTITQKQIKCKDPDELKSVKKKVEDQISLFAKGLTKKDKSAADDMDEAEDIVEKLNKIVRRNDPNFKISLKMIFEEALK